MARIRTVKPEFFRDEELQELEIAHPELKPMLFFEGLWCQADRMGNFAWKPKTLHLDILPFIEFSPSASLMLLREAGLLSQYTGPDGKEYGHINTFNKHQRINGKEAQDPPRFPEFVQGSTGEALGKQQGRREGKGREGEREGNCGDDQTIDMQVHEIASLYPKIDDAFHLSRAVAGEIAEAIVRDGRDLVWAGVKCMADEIAHWPKVEWKFLPSPERFFRESQYRKDPEFWKRSNGNGKQSAISAERNVDAALDARRAARRAVGLDH